LSSLDTNFTTITNSVNGLTNGASQINVASISATGTANATTYLRGDGAWATISGGGSGTVTSINANSTIGFTFTGGPVTSSGTLTLSGPTPGTSGNVLTSNGTAWVSQASAAAGTANVITYNSSNTFTKIVDVPSGATTALIECWGGGGGASRTTTATAQNGGGGGGYTYRIILISSLGPTETVTVGAGGLGATATAVGGVGGNSSFGSWLTAYGGAGGSITGGVSATIFTTSNATGGGGTGISGQYIGVNYDGTTYYQSPQIYNGGVGGTNGVLASSSVYGGGGGGCGTTNLTGGISILGGSGGNAAATAVAGTQPGGGGGASTAANTNGAAGGAGRVKITMW
jgi:hypothetical protein